MRISDWSSDVCSSDLPGAGPHPNPSPASQERGFGALLLPGNLAGGLLGAGLFRRGLPGCLARGSLLRCLARCGLLRGLPCRCLLGGLAWRGLFRRGLLPGLARSGLLRGFLLRGLLGGALLLQRVGFGLARVAGRADRILRLVPAPCHGTLSLSTL